MPSIYQREHSRASGNTSPAREREVLKYLPTWMTDELSSPDRAPVICPDSALNAFAQLVALRLNVDRCLISLIDGSKQFILSEATQTLSLQSSNSLGEEDGLLFGTVAIPRINGLCETSLKLAAADEAWVVPNIQDHAILCARNFSKSRPDIKFYAARPININGLNVGTICIYDRAAREVLTGDEQKVFKDMALTIAHHLESARTKESHSLGLDLFAALDSLMMPKSDDIDAKDHTTLRETQIESRDGISGDITENVGDVSSAHSSGNAVSVKAREIELEADRPAESNANDILCRACDLLLHGYGADSVKLFEAGSWSADTEHNLQQSTPANENITDSSSEDNDDGCADTISQASKPNLDKRPQQMRRRHLDQPKYCEVLASTHAETIAERSSNSLRERDLQSLLHRYPRGKVFYLEDADCDSTTSRDDKRETERSREQDSTSDADVSVPISHRRGRKGVLNCLARLFPDARSIAFFPLWDVHRQRWYAGGFACSNWSSRFLFVPEDLRFLSAFSLCVMGELSRRDSLLAEVQKETFTSMISHELRSPLHGILANVELLRDIGLDQFQITLLDTIDGCGHSLLDIVNHLLDHTAMVAIDGKHRQGKYQKKRIGRLHSYRNETSTQDEVAVVSDIQVEEDIDVVAVAEEVISGLTSAVQLAVDVRHGYESESEHHLSSTKQTRRQPFMVYAIHPKDNWVLRLQSGAFRRILTNLVGNAQKFTPNGAITISLYRDDPEDGAVCNVTLEIADTGCGMSKAFMRHHLFKQFQQEDPHALGSGLGLSIVWQMVQELRGVVEIKSEKEKGTVATVQFPCELVSQSPPSDGSKPLEYVQGSLAKIKEACRGITICFVKTSFYEDEQSQCLEQSRDSVARICIDWFDMKVTYAKSLSFERNVINVVDESYLIGHAETDTEKSQRGHAEQSPPTIFIETSNVITRLLKDPAFKAKARDNIFFVTNPAGPHQLGRILSLCLDRMPNVEHTHIETSTADRVSETVLRLPEENSTALPIRSLGQGPADETQKSVSNEDWAKSPTEPDAPAQPVPVREMTIPVSETTGSPVVMLVEDNAINMRILEMAAKKLKVKYAMAFDGQQAVELFDKEPMKYDLIWMDIMMPQMSGTIATKHIRRIEKRCRRADTKPSAQIVALTGMSGPEIQAEANSCGMDEFFTKPVKLAVLKQSVENWMNRT